MNWSIKFNSNENETLDNNEMNVEFSRDGWTIDWPILNVVTFYQNRSKLFHSIHGENGLTASWCRLEKDHTIWYSLCRWWRQAHKSRNFTTYAIIYSEKLKILEWILIRKNCSHMFRLLKVYLIKFVKTGALIGTNAFCAWGAFQDKAFGTCASGHALLGFKSISQN